MIRCIFVLTQANLYFDDDDDEYDDDNRKESKDINPVEKKKVEMKTVMAEWSEDFKKTLEKYGAPENIIMNMPVCVAGNRKTLALPVTEDWIETLLETCRSTGKEFQDVVQMVENSAKVGGAIGAKADDKLRKVGMDLGITINDITIGQTIGELIGWKYGEYCSKAMIAKRLEEKHKMSQ